MKILTLLLFFVFLYTKSAAAEELRWELMHQNDYDVIPHHIEGKWFNESYGTLHSIALVKYNRTDERTINASITLIKKLDEGKFYVNARFFKLVSNAYKPFPINVNIDVCKEYKRNSFDMVNLIKQYSNIPSCSPPPGHYNIIHFRINFSKAPPNMPRGDYKSVIWMYNGEDKLLNIEWYASIVNKPRILPED